MAKANSTSPALAADEARWRAESDHRTLKEAAQIVADKLRLRAVMAQHRKEKAGLKTLGEMLLRNKLGM